MPQLTMRRGMIRNISGGVQHLHNATYLDSANPPGVDRDDVVNDEGHLGVPERVTVLLARREIVATDIDGVVTRVVSKAGRHDVRSSVRSDSRQAPEAYAAASPAPMAAL